MSRDDITCPLPGWPPQWSRAIGRIRFAGISGHCHPGHSRCVRQLKREQAEYRNGLSRPGNRKVNQRRVKRPRQEPAPLVACPWPWKDVHPDREAASKHLRWLKANEEGYKTAEVYACPAPGGHFHLGHPRVPARRGRKERFEREDDAA
jgi:hypothetical protein